MPTIRAASVPLYQPKPMRPLPEWTKSSSLVPDQLLPQVSFHSYPQATLAYAIPSPPKASSTFSPECEWAYGAPVAGATIEEMFDLQEIGFNNDDVDDDPDEDIDNDEYDDDGGSDMEGTERGFESEKPPGFHMATPEIRMSPFPSDPPAFRGTLSSAAVPLSSSSLLCQPIPDVVQNQFRPPATRTFLDATAQARCN
jgi:hypothetical protein